MTARGTVARYYPYKSQRDCDTRKRAAARAVTKAIRQRALERLPCERCGQKREVEAYHEDFDKPLEVRWFCRKHLREHHRQRQVPPVITSEPSLKEIDGALAIPSVQAVVAQATEDLVGLLDAEGVDYTTLAKRLGIRHQTVSLQMAGGFRMLTTLARYADALGYEVEVSFYRKESGTSPDPLPKL